MTSARSPRRKRHQSRWQKQAKEEQRVVRTAIGRAAKKIGAAVRGNKLVLAPARACAACGEKSVRKLRQKYCNDCRAELDVMKL